MKPRDVNWWYVLALVGVAGMVLSAAGEYLGWWKDGGEWGFWLSLGLTIVGMTLGASRAQVGGIARGMDAGFRRVETGTSAVQRQVANLEPLLVEIRDELRRRPP